MIRTIKQYEQAIAKVYGIKVEEIYSHRPAVITSKSKVMLIHFMKE